MLCKHNAEARELLAAELECRLSWSTNPGEKNEIIVDECGDLSPAYVRNFPYKNLAEWQIAVDKDLNVTNCCCCAVCKPQVLSIISEELYISNALQERQAHSLTTADSMRLSSQQPPRRYFTPDRSDDSDDDFNYDEVFNIEALRWFASTHDENVDNDYHQRCVDDGDSAADNEDHYDSHSGKLLVRGDACGCEDCLSSQGRRADGSYAE